MFVLCTEVTAKAAAVEGGSDAPSATALRELNKNDFWSFLKEAHGEGKLVVVDFYTDWCVFELNHPFNSVSQGFL